MGRWGEFLFQGDQDLDLAGEVDATFGTGEQEIGLYEILHQDDTTAEEKDRVTSVRQKLDTDGLGDKLFEKYRHVNDMFYGKYQVIIVGALMMRVGAKISEGDLQYLREVVPQINCNEGYTMPLGDQGFRGPGKRQFLAALDHYKPGVPRSFSAPCCLACGKIGEDIGKALDRCARCRSADYCDKDCQKAHWKRHKLTCNNPRVMAGGMISLNV